MCRGSGQRGLCKGLRDVLFNVQGGFSVDGEGREPPGRAAALGLQREIHHAHTHTELDAGVAQFFCQKEVSFFFLPFFLTSYRLSVPH